MSRKKIWITGAARGLGLDIAKKAAENNFEVFFGSRNTAEEYIAKGYFSKDFLELGHVHYIQCDVANQESVDKAYQEILEITPKIDILINNAGIVDGSPMIEMSKEHFDKQMQINCFGAISISQKVLPTMIKEKCGAILNITSVTAEKAFPNIGAYAASKAALAAVFRSLRSEVRNENVKITNIAIGATNTEIWHEKMRKAHGEKMMQTKSLSEAIISLAKLSLTDDFNIEEITIRPQGGDL